uniref:Endonuclease/exonuclease/phosphatase domain-containing protein n=1 Tax=Lepisosteus oculatus TaxID=7918 RepID=W5NI73_LEPOC
DSNIKIYGYHLIGAIHHAYHGVATLVKLDRNAKHVAQSPDEDTTQWIAIEIEGFTIVNIYKPPSTQFSNLPSYPHPVIYAGDFNCQHTNWGYQKNTPEGKALADWASIQGLTLLFDNKQANTFFSARWQSGTNPDLVFFSPTNNHMPSPQRSVLSIFPNSQHRPVVTFHPALVTPTPSRPSARQTSSFPLKLPDPNSTDINDSYSRFCNMIISTSNNHIPRGFRKTYIPGWDEECTNLASELESATTTERAQSIGSTLIEYLDNIRKQEWNNMMVSEIDMKHSSIRAWQTINRLTGQSHKPQIQTTSKPKTSQSGKPTHTDKQFARKVKQEIHDSWRASSADDNSHSGFTYPELITAISTLKAGKAPGPDHLHSEQLIHLFVPALEWLLAFFNNCLLKYIIFPSLRFQANV